MSETKSLVLYNSMSKKLEPVPHQEGKVGYYCCGPTVYGPAHIGNFRTFVMQDICRRVLELSGKTVSHVRNITDVDDKTIAGALNSSESLSNFTNKWKDKFHTDCNKLNLLTPHVEPSAVTHIPGQIQLIKDLVDKDLAYVEEDNSVYYRVDAFKNYGRLSNLDPDKLKQTTRAMDRDEYERDSICDFALWKARKPEDGDNYWESPYGEGRPGWHTECAAMSLEYLGSNFSLHSGGVDLLFPHHENEIAQAEGCTGKQFCQHWFHITHLLVDGKKMSKSLGNLYTLSDLEDKGFSASDLRLALLMGHYRKPLNFTIDSLHAAKKLNLKISSVLSKLSKKAEVKLSDQTYDSALEHPTGEIGNMTKAWQALLDDLNTTMALGILSPALKEIESSNDSLAALKSLNFILQVLGLSVQEAIEVKIPEEVKELAEARLKARESKNWAESDRLRDELQTKGWTVKDEKGAYKLEKLN